MDTNKDGGGAVAIFRHGRAPKDNGTRTLRQIRDYIASNEDCQRITERIRSVMPQGVEVYREAKKNARSALYGGYNERTRGRLMKGSQWHGWVHSGYVLVEVDPPDGSGVSPKQIKDAALDLDGLRQAATSMSGKGVHFVFEVAPPPADPESHELCWYVLSERVNTAMAAAGAGAVTADTQAHEMVRLAYLSYDPEVCFYEGVKPAEWLSGTERAAAYRAEIKAASKTEKAAARGVPETPRRAAPLLDEHAVDLSAAEYLGCQGGLGPGGYNNWLGMIRRLNTLSFTVSEISSICAIRGTHADCGRDDIIAAKIADGLPGTASVDDERKALRGEAYNDGWRQPGQRASGGKGKGKTAAGGAPADDGDGGYDPAEVGDLARALLDEAADSLKVIGSEVYIAHPLTGFWIPAESQHGARVAGAVLARQGIPVTGGRIRNDMLKGISQVVIDPDAHGIAAIPMADSNNAPVLPLQGGGGLDLRSKERLAAGDVRSLNCIGFSLEVCLYQPEALEGGSEFADDALSHYGSRLFDRTAYLMLGAIKALDVVSQPEPNWGKGSWYEWLKQAMPGEVGSVHLNRASTGQGRKFSSVESLLAYHRLVYLDEGEKTEGKPLTTSYLNPFADASVWVELKGVNPITVRRKGNGVMMCGGWPQLEVGQGTEARFGWAYKVETTNTLDLRLRAWMMSPAGRAWVLAYLAERAAEIHQRGFIDEGGQGAADAAEMIAFCQPELEVLYDCFEAGDGFTPTAEIEACLKAAGIDVPKTNKLAALIRKAFKKAVKERRQEDGRQSWGYRGIRRLGG